MYRGILPPFPSDGEAIDFILGVINWKEAAPAAQEEELQLSVEQALRSAPPLTAPVPVWADGPVSSPLDDEEAAPGFAALDETPADPVELADWLAAARETAARALVADSRSRSALYQAVGRAWDFALAAETQPEAQIGRAHV